MFSFHSCGGTPILLQDISHGHRALIKLNSKSENVCVCLLQWRREKKQQEIETCTVLKANLSLEEMKGKKYFLLCDG